MCEPRSQEALQLLPSSLGILSGSHDPLWKESHYPETAELMQLPVGPLVKGPSQAKQPSSHIYRGIRPESDPGSTHLPADYHDAEQRPWMSLREELQETSL